MVTYATESGLSIKNYRLMTRKEVQKFEDSLPAVDMGLCWWLDDVDPFDSSYVAHAEGNYTENDMFSATDEINYVRVALDLEDTAKAGLKSGDEFIYKGFVFTVLDDTLAISNNFVGCAKYYDSDIADYIYSDDEISCTITCILANLFR